MMIARILLMLNATSLICLGFDPQAFLNSIAAVESGNNHAAIGKAGERSAWQISKAVWQEHTSIPWTAQNTRNPALARMVAAQHLNRIRKHHATPYAMACAWNAGIGRRRYSQSTQHYARRVVNLYEEMKSR